MNPDDCQNTSHPIPLDGPTPLDAVEPALRTDTLADGVFLLLAISVFQRAVGFVREIFFCRWLDAEQLGQWDMAFGFLMLAAPLAVLSLPGTFGRYVERYRQQGHLRSFLRRTGLFCATLAVAAVSVIGLAPRWFSELVFGTPDQVALVLLLAACLLAVIALNYLTCVFMALRNVRIVSCMELTNSLVFAAVALALMRTWRGTAASAVVAYAVACSVTSLGALCFLRRVFRALPEAAGTAPRPEVWSRVLPFALWVMAINLLTNLFDVADRYMLVHYLPCSAAEALAEVGNYRSARVVPLLLASVTAMVATLVTPHLSHDWEAGRRDRVSARLNLLLKTWTVLLTTGAVAALWLGPLLFEVAFHGKFAGGLAVLPWTLVYCTWFGLALIAQKYLWCAEKAGLASIALLAGLAVSVGLNLILLPRMGLLGAVLAASAANFVALALVLMIGRRLGFRVGRATWVMLGLPVAVCLGPGLASLALLVVVMEAFRGEQLFSAEEQRELLSGAAEYVTRIRAWRGRRAEGSG